VVKTRLTRSHWMGYTALVLLSTGFIVIAQSYAASWYVFFGPLYGFALAWILCAPRADKNRQETVPTESRVDRVNRKAD